MKIHKDHTKEPLSFFMTDTTLPIYNPLGSENKLL